MTDGAHTAMRKGQLPSLWQNHKTDLTPAQEPTFASNPREASGSRLVPGRWLGALTGCTLSHRDQ